jgi:hypothetical protein
MYHFHQKQIITRYLTNNPKPEASIELKRLTKKLVTAGGISTLIGGIKCPLFL